MRPFLYRACMGHVTEVFWGELEAVPGIGPPGGYYVEKLTDREREVLEHIALGKTLDGVAGHLGISRNTAHTHLKRIYDKLGISSRAEATLRAARLGLVRL